MKKIVKKVVLGGIIAVVIILLVQIVYIRLRDWHRYNYCQNLCFEYLDDSEFIIHPFHSREKDSYIVVIPEYWEQALIKAKVKGSPVSINFINDETVEVDGKGLLFYRTRQNTMFINTESGTMKQIDASEDKTWKESGSVKIVNAKGEIDYCNDFKSLHGRGGSTWLSTIKKAYNINIGSRVSLLGMKESKKWCLLSNSQDRTNAKNYIAYYFAKELQMPFAVDQQYVSLYLNGNYNGLYLLTNSIKDNKPDLDYFVRLVRPGEPDNGERNIIPLDCGERLEIERPKKFYDETVEDLQNDFNSLIDSLRTGSGWTNKINISSFATNYLMNEFFLNIDYGNFYMYKSFGADSTIKAASIWDFDNSMGEPFNRRSEGNYPNVFAHLMGYELDSWDADFNGLIGELNKTTVFKNELIYIFANRLKPCFETFFHDEGFEELKQMLEYENQIDYLRWYPKVRNSTVEDIRSFIESRYAFYCEEYDSIDTSPFLSVITKHHLPADNNTRIRVYKVRKGESFALPLWGGSFKGWKDSSDNWITDEVTVSSDMSLCAEWGENKTVFKLSPEIKKVIKYLFIGEY